MYDTISNDGKYTTFLRIIPENRQEERLLLIQDVFNAPYSPIEYEENVFDCSNMATLLHDYLEKHAHYARWRVQVWYGENKTDNINHEWLVVIGKYGNYTVEPTTKMISDFWIYKNNGLHKLPYNEYFKTYHEEYPGQNHQWIMYLVEKSINTRYENFTLFLRNLIEDSDDTYPLKRQLFLNK